MSKDQNHEDYQEQDDNRPLTLEEQRARLRQLIIMGKERGYITYSEINDALPDDMSDADQIDNIVSMISGLGIQVTEQAPDAEDILLSDNAAAVTDDDAVAEADRHRGRNPDAGRAAHAGVRGRSRDALVTAATAAETNEAHVPGHAPFSCARREESGLPASGPLRLCPRYRGCASDALII